jgi:23S rRNA (uridine2552-2'-O)-methyltransferase
LIKFKRKNLKASSKRWLQRHHNDRLIIKAKKLGYRSRAVFKLEEINNKLNFLKKEQNIIDLGSAPGSWSQFLCKKGFKNILAIDILQMDEIKDVDFIFGNFLDDHVQKKIVNKFNKIDVVISDIAVNTTGNKKIDAYNTNSITLDVLHFSKKNLILGGAVLCKYFNGELDKDIIDFARNNFNKNKIIKPKSSRKDSKEMYIFCQK